MEAKQNIDIDSEVVYDIPLKGLIAGSKGIITSVHLNWCVISYPQNIGTSNVTSHSALLKDVSLFKTK